MMSIHWTENTVSKQLLSRPCIDKGTEKSNTALIDIMTNGPNWAPMISPVSPMPFLITSSFKNTSLLPTALDGLQVRDVDRPERIGHAHDPQIRHTDQPLFSLKVPVRGYLPLPSVQTASEALKMSLTGWLSAPYDAHHGRFPVW